MSRGFVILGIDTDVDNVKYASALSMTIKNCDVNSEVCLVPKWYTLNFSANYKYSKSLQLNATLENITDKRYRPYSSGLSAPGRNLISL